MEKTDNKTKGILSKLFSIKSKESDNGQIMNLPNWEFIIDSQGNYLNISQEVNDCLGIPPFEFLNQSIFTFSIIPSSGEKLFSSFQKQNYPINEDVIFVSINNDLLFCNLKMTTNSEEYQSKPTYIGIVQAMEDVSENDSYLISEKQESSKKIIDNFNLATSNSDKSTDNQKFENDTNNHPNNAEVFPRNRLTDTEILHNFSQEVNHIIDPIEIYKLSFRIINELIPNNNLLMGNVDKLKFKITIPIRKLKNDISYFPAHDDFMPLLESICQSKDEILLSNLFSLDQQKSKFDTHQKPPKSILGIPIIFGNQILGAILLYDDFEIEKFSNIDYETLKSISSIMANALENAELFQEMQSALAAIETREKYQSLISQAIIIIAKHGSNKLIEAFELLGKATNVSRIFHAQPKNGSDNNKWIIKEQWFSEQRFNSFHLSKEISFEIFKDQMNQLNEKGFFQANFENLQSDLYKWLDLRGVHSILVLALDENRKFPGLIILEDLTQEHYLKHDEIAYIQLISESLSNVLKNEKEILELKNQLLESEKIGEIKNNLFIANSFESILEIIINSIFHEEIDQATLYLSGSNDSLDFEHFEEVAYSCNQIRNGNYQPFSFDRTAKKSIFQTELPIFIDNLLYANLPHKIIQQFLDNNIHSLAIIPLRNKNKLLGSIILQTNTPHNFTSNEQIILNAVLPQVTLSIENLLILNKVKKVKDELVFRTNVKTLNKHQSPKELIEFLHQSLCQGAGRKHSIVVFEKNFLNDSSIRFEIVSDSSTNETTFNEDFWYESEFQNIIADTLSSWSTSDSSFTDLEIDEFQNNEIKESIIFPITDHGNLLGCLLILSNENFSISQDQIEKVGIIIDEIAVYFSKQNKSRNFLQLEQFVKLTDEIMYECSSKNGLNELIPYLENQLKVKLGLNEVWISLNKEVVNIKEEENEYLDAYLKDKTVHINKPLNYNNLQNNKILDSSIDGSLLKIPLKHGSTSLGTLNIKFENTIKYEDIIKTNFECIATQISILIENNRLSEINCALNGKISEIDKIKSQFLANVSHEFRTPLNSIIGFSKVILAEIDGPINDTQKQDLTAIFNAGQYLLHTVNGILDLTKIEAGNMQLNLSKSNIKNVINSLIPTAENLIKDKVIKFDLDIPDNLPEILIDKERISQVILNLISNAVKFTEYGKISFSASLNSLTIDQNELMITITDTGKGIDFSDQQNLFKPFTQLETNKNTRSIGSGLGLALSKSIIELHQGKIGLLKSSPGEGSTFFFTLPILNGDK